MLWSISHVFRKVIIIRENHVQEKDADKWAVNKDFINGG